MQVINLYQCQNELGEGPLWHPEEKRLYWLDILNNKVQSLDPLAGDYHVYQLPEQVSALCLRDEQSYITAGENGFGYWFPAENRIENIAHPEQEKKDGRFNDGKVDRAGRFWAGTMTTIDASSALYRLDTDRTITRMVDKVTISNGIGWSPNNEYMYYTDTLRYRIYRYDFDLSTGSISNKTEFVHYSGEDGAPDGLTVDSEGCVWCALWGGFRVERYSPSGEVINVVEVPVPQPSSCAFGGENMQQLFITTARESLSPELLEKYPESGDLFVCEPGVTGISETFFAG
jgi:sugar lactone lactonase YvrE